MWCQFVPNGAMGKSSKADALRAMREAKFSPAKSSDGRAESRSAEKKTGYLQDRRPVVISPGAGVAPGPSETKRGRPLARDRDKTLAALKPWEAEGMSRRTWYRRQREGRRK